MINENDKDKEKEDELEDFYKLASSDVDYYMEEMQRISEENARRVEERETEEDN